jgi:glutamate--cysteine ligase
MVPHLVTALNGPILDLEKRILDRTTEIERWFRLAWNEQTPPFYSSVDVRNAGFKLAPVDTNLFPGGFNNLAPEMMPLAIQAAMSAIEKICPDARSMCFTSATWQGWWLFSSRLGWMFVWDLCPMK